MKVRNGMILTALVSNQMLSFALFEAEDAEMSRAPLATVRLAAQPVRTTDEYAALLDTMLSQKVVNTSVRIGVIASVVPPLTETVMRAVHQLYPDAICLSVGTGLRTGFTIRTDAPRELGADLVALTSGALTECEPPFLVLDYGDVTTLSAINCGKSAPEFSGCAILPGPALCAEALKLYAAQLPNVSLQRPAAAIGTNTGDSMRAGLVLGNMFAVEGLARAFCTEMKTESLPLIVTGEDAEDLACRMSARYDAHLAHRGLYRLALLNARKSGNPHKRG